MIVRDALGAQVLVLGDDVPVDGYLASAFDERERRFRRITVTAPRVDDAFDVAVALDRALLELQVFIEAEDPVTLRAKSDALRAAVEVRLWFLEAGGVTWRCTFTDSSKRKLPETDTWAGEVMTLIIPASPTPTVEES